MFHILVRLAETFISLHIPAASSRLRSAHDELSYVHYCLADCSAGSLTYLNSAGFTTGTNQYYSTQTYLTLLRLWIGVLFDMQTFSLVDLSKVNNRFSIQKKNGAQPYQSDFPMLGIFRKFS